MLGCVCLELAQEFNDGFSYFVGCIVLRFFMFYLNMVFEGCYVFVLFNAHYAVVLKHLGYGFVELIRKPLNRIIPAIVSDACMPRAFISFELIRMAIGGSSGGARIFADRYEGNGSHCMPKRQCGAGTQQRVKGCTVVLRWFPGVGCDPGPSRVCAAKWLVPQAGLEPARRCRQQILRLCSLVFSRHVLHTHYVVDITCTFELRIRPFILLGGFPTYHYTTLRRTATSPSFCYLFFDAACSRSAFGELVRDAAGVLSRSARHRRGRPRSAAARVERRRRVR